MMKRILFTITLLAVVSFAFGQEAYNEAIRMAKAVADDTSRSLEERKIATFKKDALYYLGSQSYKLTPDSSATMLDFQALALFKFINLFQGRIAMSPKKDRAAIINLFKSVSLAHPRFNDPNKEMVPTRRWCSPISPMRDTSRNSHSTPTGWPPTTTSASGCKAAGNKASPQVFTEAETAEAYQKTKKETVF